MPGGESGLMMGVMPLGAGQSVGKSCILAEFYGDDTNRSSDIQQDRGAEAPLLAKVMLDCGVHVGKMGANRVPDFG